MNFRTRLRNNLLIFFLSPFFANLIKNPISFNSIPTVLTTVLLRFSYQIISTLPITTSKYRFFRGLSRRKKPFRSQINNYSHQKKYSCCFLPSLWVGLPITSHSAKTVINFALYHRKYVSIREQRPVVFFSFSASFIPSLAEEPTLLTVRRQPSLKCSNFRDKKILIEREAQK